MTKSAEFLDRVIGLLERVRDKQADAIGRAALQCAQCIGDGGLVHIFGSGHSSIIAQDMYARAGGLAPINWIVSDDLLPLRGLRSAAIERLPGLAATLLEFEPIRRGDVLIVVSQSGRNALPVEMAEAGRARGLWVVAITSLAHSLSYPSRAPSGRRLCEVADLVIDNLGIPGDAAVSVSAGSETVAVGPTSTVMGAAIVQAIASETAARLAAKGIRPPVLCSGNIEDSSDPNDRELMRLRDRSPSLLAADIARLIQS